MIEINIADSPSERAVRSALAHATGVEERDVLPVEDYWGLSHFAGKLGVELVADDPWTLLVLHENPPVVDDVVGVVRRLAVTLGTRCAVFDPAATAEESEAMLVFDASGACREARGSEEQGGFRVVELTPAP